MQNNQTQYTLYMYAGMIEQREFSSISQRLIEWLNLLMHVSEFFEVHSYIQGVANHQTTQAL